MKRRLVWACLLAAAATGGWRLARACAPDFFRAVFSYVRHPDLPRTEFIDGRLGVLQPTFARSYLVIAYRYLNGVGLSAGEREQARDYYMDKDTWSWDGVGEDWHEQWVLVRGRIKAPPAPPVSSVTEGQMHYDPETHAFALNCAPDAFRTAVHTLEARRTKFGAAITPLRSWVTAQDAVFRNCDAKTKSVPEEATADLPAAIRADRVYQMAAAQFYAGDYPAALAGFRRIAADHSSEWSTISRYLVVRTLLRMAGETPTAAQAAELKAESAAILGDPALRSIQGMTWNLVERARIRERDQTYFRDLARLLSSRGQEDGLREELWNYADLYDHVIGHADPNDLWGGPKEKPDVSRFRDADLNDWILNFQSRDAAVLGYSMARWRQSRSAAWLLAALEHADAAKAKEAGLVDAAEAIPETSPGYLTARFHLLRMKLEAGDRPAARDQLDALLGGGVVKGLPSTVNLFRGLRMLAAPSLDEFVRFAVRKPVLVALQLNQAEAPGELGPWAIAREPKVSELFDADAAGVLNRKTPFHMLEETALREPLPAGLQSEALLTAFTRGLMLGEDLTAIAKKLAEATPDVAAMVQAYLKEDSEDGRRFAAAFLLLHRPEARPYFATGITRQSRPGSLDPYRDNWWCPTDIDMPLDSRAADEWYSDLRTPNLAQESASGQIPEFLGGNAAEEAAREFEKLGKLHAATDFLGGIVLSYGEKHRDDARVPEALYWLVRAGHYGCADTDTWKTTRASFQMLQLRYGKTKWAVETPVWVKSDSEVRKK